MKCCFPLPGLSASVLMLALWVPFFPASANDLAVSSSGADSLKFIFNLGLPSQGGKYLQVEMVFEGATPKVAHAISTLRPRVQHAMILLLSSGEVGKLLTLQGKKDLMGEIVETVNQVLDEDKKTGVREVLFTRFIIQ